MSKIKILLVGDGNHQFVTNYSKWITKSSLQGDFEIDILSLTELSLRNCKFYKNSYQIKGSSFTKIRFIGKYFRLFNIKKLLPVLPRYDYVHFHFFGKESHYISDFFSKKTNSKIIISIWGSDLYRNKANSFIRACNNATVITFANEESIKFFKSKYTWTKGNLRLCRFGLEPLEYLKKLVQSKDDCKFDLGLNSKKIAVTIGYNMAPEQQHIEILNQFTKENTFILKDKIELILPITYGGSKKYKQQLLTKLKELSFEYKIFDNYLSDNDVAKIRKASDVMLQLQNTDQFSGSMQEHLYANNIVITGSWLPYQTLKDNNCWFLEVQNINELKLLIPNVISNYNSLLEKTSHNSVAISTLSSWNNNINSWINLYKF